MGSQSATKNPFLKRRLDWLLHILMSWRKLNSLLFRYLLDLFQKFPNMLYHLKNNTKFGIFCKVLENLILENLILADN